jgi:CRISPR-associated endonuclease/helicase Cas3
VQLSAGSRAEFRWRSVCRPLGCRVGVEPPRSVEAIESPSGLRGHGCGGTSACDPNLSDAADHAPEDSGEGTNRPALHYAGRGDPRSEVVRSDRPRAGDLIVVSAEYGGCDEWGWDPKSTEPVMDVTEAGGGPTVRAAWPCA